MWPVIRILFCLLPPILIAGCSESFKTADDVLFKTFAGEKPGERGTVPKKITAGPLGLPPPGLGGTRFRVDRKIGTTAKRRTGVEGQNDQIRARIFQQDDELQRIRRGIRLRYAKYAKAVNGFELESKKVLPPNDVDYRENMSDARSALAQVNGDILKLNALASRVNITAAQASQLLQQVRASKPAGEAGRKLETEVLKTVGMTHRMLAEIHLDISKQSKYTSDQSRGLDQLAEAVAAGRPVGGSAGLATLIPERTDQQQKAGQKGGAQVKQASVRAPPRKRPAKPFVRIRFDQPKVAYEAELYQALSAALRKRPDLEFEIVGVAGNANRRQSATNAAQQVMFAMAEMGVPPSRMEVKTELGPPAKADHVLLYAK